MCRESRSFFCARIKLCKFPFHKDIQRRNLEKNVWGAVSNVSLICWDSFFPPSILLPKWRDRVVYRQRWLSPIRRQSSGKLAKSFFPTPRDVQSSLVCREKLKITKQFDYREIVTSSSFIDLRILAKCYSYRVPQVSLFFCLLVWYFGWHPVSPFHRIVRLKKSKRTRNWRRAPQ